MFMKNHKAKQRRALFSRQVCGILDQTAEPKYFKHPERYQKIISQMNLADDKYSDSKLSSYARELSSTPSIEEYLSYLKRMAKLYPDVFKHLSQDALMGIRLAYIDLEIEDTYNFIDSFYRDTVYESYRHMQI